MAEEPKHPQPTASEALFFYSILKNMKAMTDIDWEAVAEDRGFKNAEVAKVRFGQVKRKLGIQTDNSKTTPKKSSGSGALAATPNKVTKTPASRSGTKGKRGGRGVKKEKVHEGSDGTGAGDVSDGVEGTPTKHEPKGEVAVKEEKTIQEHIDAMMGGDPF